MAAGRNKVVMRCRRVA